MSWTKMNQNSLDIQAAAQASFTASNVGGSLATSLAQPVWSCHVGSGRVGSGRVRSDQGRWGQVKHNITKSFFRK